VVVVSFLTAIAFKVVLGYEVSDCESFGTNIFVTNRDSEWGGASAVRVVLGTFGVRLEPMGERDSSRGSHLSSTSTSLADGRRIGRASRQLWDESWTEPWEEFRDCCGYVSQGQFDPLGRKGHVAKVAAHSPRFRCSSFGGASPAVWHIGVVCGLDSPFHRAP